MILEQTLSDIIFRLLWLLNPDHVTHRMSQTSAMQNPVSWSRLTFQKDLKSLVAEHLVAATEPHLSTHYPAIVPSLLLGNLESKVMANCTVSFDPAPILYTHLLLKHATTRSTQCQCFYGNHPQCTLPKPSWLAAYQVHWRHQYLSFASLQLLSEESSIRHEKKGLKLWSFYQFPHLDFPDSPGMHIQTDSKRWQNLICQKQAELAHCAIILEISSTNCQLGLLQNLHDIWAYTKYCKTSARNSTWRSLKPLPEWNSNQRDEFDLTYQKWSKSFKARSLQMRKYNWSGCCRSSSRNRILSKRGTKTHNRSSRRLAKSVLWKCREHATQNVYMIHTSCLH